MKKLKDQLSSNQVLVHYDTTLPVSLACDASQYGVGAVISHLMPDRTERPIAYGSICDRICEKGSSTHIQFFDFERP